MEIIALSPFLKWSLVAIVLVLVALAAGLSYMAGSPKDAIEMVRYALPYMHRGDLRVGSGAPDATLVNLDGTTTFRLHQRIGGKPLVLVFGSFT